VFQVADGLLEDKQDLVRKGYGWLLNEASKHHPQEVFNFVIKRRDRMPRVSLRYAVKKLPEDMRQQALQNYCSQRRIRR
jgi:3-methyladenine DNA glycosylase AlkD